VPPERFLDDLPVVHRDDDVGMRDGAQAVCDHERRSAFEQCRE